MSVKTGIAAIANEVVGDVQKEAEALILAAENEAKETLRAAKDKSRASLRSIIVNANEKAEAEKRKIGSIAEVEVRNRLLQTKEELVDATFEKATDKLKEFVRSTEYPNYLLNLIENVAGKMGQENLIVQVNVKDKGWLTPSMLKKISTKSHTKLELSNETENFIGGCRIQTNDGKKIYDATFDYRLTELTPRLRVIVAKQLFGAS